MRRFLLFFVLCVGVSNPAYSAEPPIEVIYWQASDVQTPSQADVLLIFPPRPQALACGM